MDIVGPLPTTDRGNKYILTIQDNLTKFVIAKPIPNQQAETIAERFIKDYVSNFGAPQIVLTDNGTNFTSNLMKEFEHFIRIKHVTTTAFHPESNGSLERSHQVLKEYLKTLGQDDHRDWDELIELATMSYNSSVHESTGPIPYELVYGQKLRTISSFRRKQGRTYQVRDSTP